MGLQIVTRRNSSYQNQSNYGNNYRSNDRLIKQTSKQPTVRIEPDLNKIFLSKLDLSVRTLNALKNVGVDTVADLAELTREEIKDIPRIGDTAVAEIETALIKNNLFSKTKLFAERENMASIGEIASSIEIYDKSEVKEYSRPRIPKEFKVYTWMYYNNETWEELEAYKPLIAEKFRYRYKDFIEDTDIVTIVWSDYMLSTMTRENKIDVPKGADVRLYTKGDSEKNTMSFCMGFCMILDEKMTIPIQPFCEAIDWLGSLRMPEFRSPMILHKDRLKKKS